MVQADSWPELIRRYFALAATAALVKSTDASGGLDTALGSLVGATPLSLLGPFAVLQSLTAGAHTGEPGEAGAARLPLVGLGFCCWSGSVPASSSIHVHPACYTLLVCSATVCIMDF